ncbi:MAG: iron-sulfur cluster assembly accessory protein [Gammaproteobacteria bacterium]|nr:iron-sulfur cluster assembly accessory protein [Gammaproteobacteria bacterium]
MNTAVNKDGITLTPHAIDHVYTMLTDRGHGIGLRLGVKTLGCSGYAYNIGFLDETNTDDKVFEINRDITIAVDKNSYPMIKGTAIDFIREGLSRQFSFKNPNAKDQCGCGESFSV